MIVGRFVRTRMWQNLAFQSPPKDWIYKRALDIPFHLMGSSNQFLLNTKLPLNLAGFDMFHSYNSLVLTKKPWILEMESMLPRFGPEPKQWQRRMAISLIKASNCKLVSFTCEGSMQLNAGIIEEAGISRKTAVVFRPSPFIKCERDVGFWYGLSLCSVNSNVYASCTNDISIREPFDLV